MSHDEVNHGYFGLLAAYSYRQDRIVHPVAQLLVGFGGAKDYEREKTSAFDNFGNTSGPGFFLIEPEIGGELNLTDTVRFSVGLGYRLVSGMDEDDELISMTRVTNGDLSGVTLVTGLRLGG